MSVTFTQLKQTINLAEKVKVDSGEKIVKTEKVGRKKNIEVTVTTKGGKYFVYFDKEKYAGSYRSEKDTDKIINDYLKLVGEELQENRAKRDAFKAMGRRTGKDAADIDNTATDDDRKAADKNIMMQLRKAVSLRGMKPIEFADGKKAKVDPKVADKLLTMYQGLKPASKMQLQTVLAKSKRDFDNAVKQLKINEYFDDDINEGKMKQFHMMMDSGKTAEQIAKALKLDLKSVKELMKESVELIEAGLPPHLAKLFDKDGNFKDPKKQKIFNRMMGDGIGKEIAQKMGRIKFRVDADSAKKTVKVYVDSNDEKDAQRALKMHPAYISGNMRVIPEEVELTESPMVSFTVPNVTSDMAKKLERVAKDKGIEYSRKGRTVVLKGKRIDMTMLRTKMGLAQTNIPMVPVNEEVELDEGKSSTGYELYHKDFSSAMKHAYDHAKKKFGIEIDPQEIDDKVASGPRKPSKGKTNTYRLKGKDGKKAVQIQVYGMDNGKYELNMYKESVELEESRKYRPEVLDKVLKIMNPTKSMYHAIPLIAKGMKVDEKEAEAMAKAVLRRDMGKKETTEHPMFDKIHNKLRERRK